MFWSKTGREARRQKVLDELLEIAPADRARRLEEAVAAGDVRAAEVEQALRLVDRLDAVRVMATPHPDGGPKAANASDLEIDAPSEDTAPAPITSTESEPTISAGRVAKAKERRAIARKASRPRVGSGGKAPRSRTSTSRLTAIPVVREPKAIPIEPELPVTGLPDAPPAVDPRILAAPMPIDAVEAAARLIARNIAARKAVRASAMPRRRGHRSGNDVTPSPEPALSAAGGPPADAAGPSIDWLRP
jgi:hypothetical protein